jgi:predicted alpha/beta superfamily hydrolase
MSPPHHTIADLSAERRFVPGLKLELQPGEKAPLGDGAGTGGGAPVPVTLPGCRKLLLRSKETGAVYEIFVFVPDAAPPPSGFPAICVLDANAEFVTVAETIRRVSLRPQATGIGPSIVVGIGYPQTDDYNMDRRHFDFTRGPAAGDGFSERTPQECGGQAAFIRFLRNELQPHAASYLPIDPAQHALFGHSLGGYFVFDLLAQHPEMFSAYMAFSPSIWWDWPGLSQSLARLTVRPGRQIRVYSAVGRWEDGDLAPWQTRGDFSPEYFRLRDARRMIGNARDAVARVDATFKGRASVKFEIGRDDDHATVVTSCLCNALRFVLR